MVMRMTSLNAFNEISSNGVLGLQEQLVLDCIRENPKFTRKQVARYLDLDVSSVSGRVNGLMNKNLVTDSKKGKCPISGKVVGLLEVVR